MAGFDWQPGQLPEGWQRGDQLRIMNNRFVSGDRSALLHCPDVFDLSRAFKETDIAAISYCRADIQKVKAWLEWYRGDTPLKDIFK